MTGYYWDLRKLAGLEPTPGEKRKKELKDYDFGRLNTVVKNGVRYVKTPDGSEIALNELGADFFNRLGKRPEGLVHILEIKKAYKALPYGNNHDLEFYVNQKGSKERILFFPITEDGEYFAQASQYCWLGSTTYNWVAHGVFYYDQEQIKFKSNYVYIGNKKKGEHNFVQKSSKGKTRLEGTWKSSGHSGKLTWILKE